MAKWVCSVCGYVHEGDETPEKCLLELSNLSGKTRAPSTLARGHNSAKRLSRDDYPDEGPGEMFHFIKIMK